MVDVVHGTTSLWRAGSGAKDEDAKAEHLPGTQLQHVERPDVNPRLDHPVQSKASSCAVGVAVLEGQGAGRNAQFNGVPDLRLLVFEAIGKDDPRPVLLAGYGVLDGFGA
jgi:hypothetical protein